jgi:hypothetical protein
MTKTMLACTALAALLLAGPAFAQMAKDTMGKGAMECSDASLMKTSDMTMKMADGPKKQMATKELGMAKDAMMKKDSKGCMMHMENAEKAMK